MNVSLVLDMFGCPNRCKHCWLGHMKNKKMTDSDSEYVVNEFKKKYDDITFYSWLREPDYCDNYEERWNKDNVLSTIHKPLRFELASFYRIVRDKNYVDFLNKVGTKKVQLTFFGLKDMTDKYIGRIGAFEELLEATEILIDNGIIPRWQIFINEENKDEILKLISLTEELKLKERCKDFSFFIHAGSCDGENAKLYSIRIKKESINPLLIPYFLEYNYNFTESECYSRLIGSSDHFVPHHNDDIVLNIDNEFNVYFNYTNIRPIWCIGNIKSDGINTIYTRILNDDVPALNEAKKITLSQLAKKYGDKKSTRLFELDDYKMYLLNCYLEDKQRLR